MRQARRELSEAKIKEWGDCEIVSDGEVIATLTPVAQAGLLEKSDYLVTPCNVAQTSKAKSSVAHLRFSKDAQAKGRLSDS